MKQAFVSLLLLLTSNIVGLSAQGKSRYYTDRDTTIYSENALDNVVVTGSRTPRLLKSEPVPVRVIKAKEIKILAPQNFMDLMQYVLPGVEFGKHGAQDKISMQGFSGSALLFLIDGELITTGAGNTIDFERINPDEIERIEVLRGASSALYGSNAIGGVINIITRNAKEPFRVVASARVDSRLGQKYDLSLGLKRGILASQTGVQYRTERSYLFADSEGNGINVAGNKAWSLSEKLTFTPMKDLQISLTGRANLRAQHWSDKIDFMYDSYDVIGGVRWKISNKASSDFSYHYNNYLRDTLFVQTANKERSHIFTEQMHHLRAQFNYEWTPERYINTGVEYIHDAVASDRFVSPTQGKEQHIRNCIFYGQGVYQIVPKLTLNYGGRLDLHSGFGAHYTSRASVMYKPIEDLSLRLSYSEGYRAPTLQEQFFFFHHQPFYILGNPDLKPEKSRMLSLSSEGKWSHISVMANLFYNNVYSRIALQNRANAQSGQTDYVYTNIEGQSRIFGAEMQTHISLPKGFGLRLSATYTNDKRNVRDASGNNVAIYDTRPFSALGAITYDKYYSSKYSVSANLSLRYLSSFTAARFDEQGYAVPISYPGYFYSRLALEQRFFKHYSLNLGVDNILDFRPQRIYVNTPVSPGRVYSLTFRVQF